MPGSDFGPLVPHLDKAAHFVLYAILGSALAWVRLQREPPPPHGLLIVLGILYGLSDEIHQMYVPGRSPDVADLVADALGVMTGYGLFLRWRGRAQAGNPGESR